MKTIIFKTLFLISIFSMHNCKAQTVNDYITFYNGVTPKLNVIATYKTQFYGQNFSSFYNELLSKQIGIVALGLDSKIDTSSKYYILRLYFCDSNMDKVALNNPFQIPWVSITFENEISEQIKNTAKQYHGEWNTNLAQLFATMKIESIKFVGINGYDSDDWSGK